MIIQEYWLSQIGKDCKWIDAEFTIEFTKSCENLKRNLGTWFEKTQQDGEGIASQHCEIYLLVPVRMSNLFIQLWRVTPVKILACNHKFHTICIEIWNEHDANDAELVLCVVIKFPIKTFQIAIESNKTVCWDLSKNSKTRAQLFVFATFCQTSCTNPK